MTRGAVAGRSGLDQLYVGCRGALRPLLGLVAHLGPFRQRPKAAALDRTVVNEQVLARIIRRDKAVALLAAEPLHGSRCHLHSSDRSCAAKRGRCKEQQQRTLALLHRTDVRRVVNSVAACPVDDAGLELATSAQALRPYGSQKTVGNSWTRPIASSRVEQA